MSKSVNKLDRRIVLPSQQEAAARDALKACARVIAKHGLIGMIAMNAAIIDATMRRMRPKRHRKAA